MKSMPKPSALVKALHLAKMGVAAGKGMEQSAGKGQQSIGRKAPPLNPGGKLRYVNGKDLDRDGM